LADMSKVTPPASADPSLVSLPETSIVIPVFAKKKWAIEVEYEKRIIDDMDRRSTWSPRTVSIHVLDDDSLLRRLLHMCLVHSEAKAYNRITKRTSAVGIGTHHILHPGRFFWWVEDKR
jgi:hypothetical protein